MFNGSRKLLNFFEITKTNNSNSESSEEFLKQNAFLTFSWRFFRSITLEQLEFKLEKIIGILKKVCRKS